MLRRRGDGLAVDSAGGGRDAGRPGLLARDDDDVGVERIRHRDHGSKLRIALGREEPPHTGGILVDRPCQLGLAERVLDAQGIKSVDDLVDPGDRTLLALELGLELRVLGQALRQPPLVTARIELLRSRFHRGTA